MKEVDFKKIFHQTVGRGIALAKEKRVASEFSNLRVGEYFVGEKPVYISQLADAQLGSIEGFYERINDKDASARFGAVNLDEFSYWAWRSCGIVGVQMLLSTLLPSFNKKTMDLVTEGLDIGGYDVGADVGWYHDALAKLTRKYGLKAETRKFISSSEVAKLVLDQKYSLASIKSNTGGHLLLVYGFRIGQNHKIDGFIVNDPNDYKTKGDEKFVAKKDFDEMFTRRVIVIGK